MTLEIGKTGENFILQILLYLHTILNIHSVGR